MATAKPTAEEVTRLESEHGPIVFIDHPDGTRFGFMALTREKFDLREARAKRGEGDSDEKLFQERCVWPSRDEWNKYVAASVFETLLYIKTYRDAFGGADVRPCDPDEKEERDPSLLWLTNGVATFGFRKPGRAEVKMFGASLVADRPPGAPHPIETMLRQCGGADFATWVDANPFAISKFGDAFCAGYGMTGEARVSGK